MAIVCTRIYSLPSVSHGMVFNKSEKVLPSEIHQSVLSPLLLDQCVQVESHYYLLPLVK